MSDAEIAGKVRNWCELLQKHLPPEWPYDSTADALRKYRLWALREAKDVIEQKGDRTELRHLYQLCKLVDEVDSSIPLDQFTLMYFLAISYILRQFESPISSEIANKLLGHRKRGGQKTAKLTPEEWKLIVKERDARAARNRQSRNDVSVTIAAELIRGKFDGIERKVEISPETIRAKQLSNEQDALSGIEGIVSSVVAELERQEAIDAARALDSESE